MRKFTFLYFIPRTEIHLGGSPENKYKDATVMTKFTKIFHPKYNKNADVSAHDIGLIKLEEPVKLSATINIICLPFNEPEVPKRLTLPEWIKENDTDQPEIEEHLVEGKTLLNCSVEFFQLAEDAKNRIFKKCLETKTEAYCRNASKKFFKPITDDQFCAGNDSEFKTQHFLNGISIIYVF